MKSLTALLALPASLLTLLTNSVTQAHDSPWRSDVANVPMQAAELEALLKRERKAQEKLAQQGPIGVKKMSGDEGEKFFLHYWNFGESSSSTEYEEELEHSVEHGNNSRPFTPLPGIAPHSENNGIGMMLFARSLFARDFECPGSTYSCSASIGYNICCKPDQTCVSTDAGPGCCPAGETCGDSVGDCTGGYTSCNDGCCIPGAVCKGEGCILYGTQTVTTTLQTVTRTSGASSTTVTGTGRTVTVFQPTVSTTTVTVSPSGQTTTTPVAPIPPVLPTSHSSGTTSTTSGCLPGYYMCSAHYLGGCCKVGRDCDTTHCPPTGTTITAAGGVTVVESAATNVHRTCDSGLYSCPASVQGGCCPSGYTCGIETCTAGRNGIGNVAKVAPSSANVLRWAGGLLALAITTGVGMILL